MAEMPQDPLPLLVIVSGAPGSGKTTLAEAVAKRLRLLHLERDLLMWGMRYTADGKDVDRPGAGIRTYYDTMQTMLRAGVSFVTDATLYQGKSEPDIQKFLLPYARIINVHCRSKDEAGRFYARELARNAGQAPDWLEEHMGHLKKIYPLVVDPLDFGAERIEVDTTIEYNPTLEAIVSQIGDRNHAQRKDSPYGS